jgi:hypothetical protein
LAKRRRREEPRRRRCRGHYIRGTAIDHGNAFITQRVVFRGGLQTREYAYAKLLGIEHDARLGL